MKHIEKTVASFFLSAISKLKYNVILLFTGIIIWPLSKTLGPYLLKLIINGIVNSPISSHSEIFMSIYPQLLACITLWIVFYGVFIEHDILYLKTIPVIKGDMHKTLSEYVGESSYQYFQENLSGSISNKIRDIGDSFEDIFKAINLGLYPSILSFIFGIIALWQINPTFSMLMGIWWISLFIITTTLALQCIERSEESAQAKTLLAGKTVDSLSNVMTTKMFAQTKYENDYLDFYRQIAVKKEQASKWAMIKINFVTTLFCIGLIIYMFATLIINHNLHASFGDFAFVPMITFSIMNDTWEQHENIITIIKELGTAQQSLALLAKEHEITDLSNAHKLIVSKGNIEFKNVFFGYKPDSFLVKNLSLTIAPGSCVGIVGSSGSGKTTLINLILRNFNTTSGSIAIDDQNISEVSLESLHNAISLIPQDTILFNRSIIENIRYGNLQATDQEVISSSKKAGCHEWINKLPGSYDFIVGERGTKLSGGQRQRIAIARAYLKNAPIFILDEATSALDSFVEQRIQKSLFSLIEGKTSLVISHKLSILSKMNRIIVLKNGAITEDGTHEELLAQNRHYAHLWNLQMSGFLPEEEGL